MSDAGRRAASGLTRRADGVGARRGGKTAIKAPCSAIKEAP